MWGYEDDTLTPSSIIIMVRHQDGITKDASATIADGIMLRQQYEVEIVNTERRRKEWGDADKEKRVWCGKNNGLMGRIRSIFGLLNYDAEYKVLDEQSDKSFAEYIAARDKQIKLREEILALDEKAWADQKSVEPIHRTVKAEFEFYRDNVNQAVKALQSAAEWVGAAELKYGGPLVVDCHFRHNQ